MHGRRRTRPPRDGDGGGAVGRGPQTLAQGARRARGHRSTSRRSEQGRSGLEMGQRWAGLSGGSQTLAAWRHGDCRGWGPAARRWGGGVGAVTSWTTSAVERLGRRRHRRRRRKFWQPAGDIEVEQRPDLEKFWPPTGSSLYTRGHLQGRLLSQPPLQINLQGRFLSQPPLQIFFNLF